MNAELLITHFNRISEAPEAIPRLRQFVIDLAVRGKLVEQDPKDEPASELLEKVKTERKRLFREGVFKSDKVTREIQEGARPYSLPSVWQWIRLGECLEMINGRAFKPTDWLPVGLPIVRIQNLNTESASFNYCDESSVEQRHIIESGCFLISWSGTPGTSFGAFIWKRGKAALNQHIFKCILIGGAYYDRFLQIAINGRLDEMIAKAHGGVGLQHITKGKLENLPLSLPPLAEQHRIVAKVDELMALCDRLEGARSEREARRDRLAEASHYHLNSGTDAGAFRDHANFYLGHLPRLTARPDQVKQLRQSIFNFAVRGQLVPQDPNDESASELLARVAAEKAKAGNSRTGRDWTVDILKSVDEAFCIPEGWAWTRIANAVERVTVGYVGPMKDHYVEGGVPFLRSQNVRANRFRSDGLISISFQFHRTIAKSALAPGDVVVVRSGNVGTACVIPGSLPVANCSDLVVVKRPLAVLPDYLCFYLNSLAASHIEEGSVGVALTHFNTKSVATMPLPVPPLAEQRRIIAKVDQLITVCDQLEIRLTESQANCGRLLEAVLHRSMADA